LPLLWVLAQRPEIEGQSLHTPAPADSANYMSIGVVNEKLPSIRGDEGKAAPERR